MTGHRSQPMRSVSSSASPGTFKWLFTVTDAFSRGAYSPPNWVPRQSVEWRCAPPGGPGVVRIDSAATGSSEQSPMPLRGILKRGKAAMERRPLAGPGAAGTAALHIFRAASVSWTLCTCRTRAAGRPMLQPARREATPRYQPAVRQTGQRGEPATSPFGFVASLR